MSADISRTSPLAWAQASLLVTNLVWTTLSLGGLSAGAMVITSSLTWISFTLLMWRSAQKKEEPGAASLPSSAWAFLPFIGYLGINVLTVTPVPWLGWRDAAGWVNLILTFWIALEVVRTPGPRQLVFAAVASLGVVVVLLQIYQRFFDPQWLMLGRSQVAQFVGRASGLFGIPNSCAAFLILLIPSAVVGCSRARSRAGRVTAMMLTGIFTFGLVLTVSRGAWIALGAVLAVRPLFRAEQRWSTRLKTTAAVSVAVAGLGLFLYAVVPEVRERFEMLRREAGERSRPILWRGAWELWRESPVVGTGAGSYGVLVERHRPERFNDNPRWAHNDYLNTLSDYGALGFGLFFGACGWVSWRRKRRAKAAVVSAPSAADGLGMGVAAFGVTLVLDFHLKIPALAMVAACGFAAWVEHEKPPSLSPSAWVGPRGGRKGLPALGALAAALWFGLVVLPQQRAEVWRQRGRAWVDGLASGVGEISQPRENLVKAQTMIARAVALEEGNAQAWSDAAYVLVLRAGHERVQAVELARQAEAAARRALGLAAEVPEFWWRLGAALDGQGRWIEGGSAYRHATVIAPNSARSWYYLAYHLSLQTETREQALSALATCLRLDPGWRVAELLREQLAISLGYPVPPPP